MERRTMTSAGGGGQTVTAELMYDTGREPKPHGIRTLGPPCRHLLYRAAGYDVDVRIERGDDECGTVVVGQVLDSRRPRTRMAGMPVRSLDSAGTVTDRLGEFELVHDPDRPLELHLEVDDGLTVAVPIERAGMACMA